MRTTAGPGRRFRTREPDPDPSLRPSAWPGPTPEVTSRDRARAEDVTATLFPAVQVSQSFPGPAQLLEARRGRAPALQEGVKLSQLQWKKTTPKGTRQSARSAITVPSSRLASTQQLEARGTRVRDADPSKLHYHSRDAGSLTASLQAPCLHPGTDTSHRWGHQRERSSASDHPSSWLPWSSQGPAPL